MDIKSLKRDPKVISSGLKELPDGSMAAVKDFKIHIPAVYLDRELAFLSGKDKQILGIFAAIVDNSYAVMTIPNLLNISPLDHSRFTHEGTEYLEIYFPAGSTVFKTKDVLVNDGLVYEIYDLYIDTDIDPWFLSALDRASLLNETPYYVNAGYGAHRNVMKMVWAFTMRQPKDKTKFFRSMLETQADWDRLAPIYIPFKSVIYGPKTTTAKFNGAYFDLARTAALVNHSEKSDDMEKILRL